MNFQYATTTIAFVQMARGQPLRWLEGLADDIPVAVNAETGGPGDDISLLLASGETVEVQVKKGLQIGDDFWRALLKLARGVTDGTASFGVLAVSPRSSSTITDHLALDIERIGQGRTDDLSDHAETLLRKLQDDGLEAAPACARLRIQTIAAQRGNNAAVSTALAELGHICAKPSQIKAAWNALFADAARLVEARGRRDAAGLLNALRGEHIDIASDGGALGILDRITSFNFETSASYTIVGVKKPLSIDEAWIPLVAIVREESDEEEVELGEALRKYQDWERRAGGRDATSVDPETLCRFITKTVLVAGPGMGKSTLLKRIARRYSADGLPVLRVRLSTVAKRMQAGDTFEEAVFNHGLDGAQITAAEVLAARFPNWVLLCDGLDECGTQQEDVAEGVARFAKGHPDSRILVTTRPIGYRAAHFGDWRHYDLAALDYSSAHGNAARLVEAIADAGTAIAGEAWNICWRELQGEPAAKIVGRTPLLLGLAAAILANGASLPASRERLFEQIFELIDDAPNSRIPHPPASAQILRRFLDALAWTLTTQPLATVSAIVDACAVWFADATGRPFLAAMEHSEGYLEYWDKVGMIERVGNGDRETLSFIHKSFGEFAAARHLRSLPPTEQRTALALHARDSDWAEVVRFGGLLGLADALAKELLLESDADQLAFAAELVADGNPPPEWATRRDIFANCAAIMAGKRRRKALAVGRSFIRAAARFPDEARPLVALELASEQDWTRLIAWTTIVKVGRDQYELETLKDQLSGVAAALTPAIRPGLGGGVTLGRGADHGIAEEFILGACAEILDRTADPESETLVEKILNNPHLGYADFITKANVLLERKGLPLIVEKTGLTKSDLFDHPPGYREAEYAQFDMLFEALDLPDGPSIDDPATDGPLIHFSAFIEASQMGKVSGADVWRWAQPFDREAAREALLAFIAVSGIDIDKLREDAIAARHYFATEGRRRYSSLYVITVPVDPPPTNWALAKTLKIDPGLIEETFRHPSHWMKWIAANLLEHLLTADELTQAVERLMRAGSGLTLWAAAASATELPSDRAKGLILARLAKPLVRGCEHLFALLGTVETRSTPELIMALRAGLFADDTIVAAAAAKLAGKVDAATPELIELLDDAYAHWLVHEPPYPDKGGEIRHTPRIELVEALIRWRAPTYDEMKNWITDRRHEIKESGTKALLAYLAAPSDGRRTFLAGKRPA